METPVQNEVAEDDALVCPACKAGTITAYFQVDVEVYAGGPVRIITDPDSNSFLNAGCNNLECDVELTQESGDGRLRNAHLEHAASPFGKVVVIEDNTMLAAFTKAVEIILKKQGSS